MVCQSMPIFWQNFISYFKLYTTQEIERVFLQQILLLCTCYCTREAAPREEGERQAFKGPRESKRRIAERVEASNRLIKSNEAKSKLDFGRTENGVFRQVPCSPKTRFYDPREQPWYMRSSEYPSLFSSTGSPHLPKVTGDQEKYLPDLLLMARRIPNSNAVLIVKKDDMNCNILKTVAYYWPHFTSTATNNYGFVQLRYRIYFSIVSTQNHNTRF